MTGLAASIGGLVAYIHGGALYRKYGIKTAITICFTISALATSVLIAWGLDHQKSWLFPVLVTVAEYGIAASFTVIYVAHSEIFPILFATTALGLCNFTSRSLSAFAPLLATVEQPVPFLVFGFLCLTSALAIWKLDLAQQ